MIIADAWLLELGLEGRTARSVAELCLVCQVRVWNSRNHILALNDERARTDIRRAAKEASIPHSVVRCLRCGCEAWFLDWWASACFMTPNRQMHLERYRKICSRTNEAFLNPCPGDERAQVMLLLLRTE